jgi:NADP-dependent aldehyde dehydrogenase
VTGTPRDRSFPQATPAETDAAVAAAQVAARSLGELAPQVRARLLDAISDNLAKARDTLVSAVTGETGLPEARAVTELARTCHQLRQFSWLLREGWYVEAIVDLPDANAIPAPRPDLRRMLVPLGPVAVFGASNFPLAFSVPGGDTAAALAAGCPVVVKGHPSHPETSEICGRAIQAALASEGLDPGGFSLLHGDSNAVGSYLVQHPGIAAVGFTGSEAGGRALHDLAAARPVPIPVYAEMGSLNPVVLTSGALAARGEEIASGLVRSVLGGNGQFCTKPGVVLVPTGPDGDALVARVRELLAEAEPACMLSTLIRDAFVGHVARTEQITGPEAIFRGPQGTTQTVQQAVIAEIDAATLLGNERLMTEHFGPFSLLVRWGDEAVLEAVLRALPGGLTSTVHAEPHEYAGLVDLLRLMVTRAGRVLFNDFPTGVSVTGAMTHGGPYPGSTSSGHTSVGWTSIRRFLRPVTYQDVPGPLLPAALRDGNPLAITRLVNGEFTSAALAPG